MINEKISIIIPVYNCEAHLCKCLDSVIFQSYTNIEAICVNDGSTDKSLDILKEYRAKDPRIIIINQKNQGVSIARNVAIRHATGEYIMFMDADDFLERDACRIMHSHIKKYNTDLVRANYRRVYPNKKPYINKQINCTSNKVLNAKNISEYFLPKLINGEIRTYLWLLCIKKSIITEHHVGFIKDIKMMQDKLFYFDLIANINNMVQVEDVIYNYFCNAKSTIMSLEKCQMRCKYILIVMNLLLKKIKAYGLETHNENQTLMANHFCMIVRELTYTGETNAQSILHLLNFLSKNAEFKELICSLDPRFIPKPKKLIFYILKKEKKNIAYLYISAYCKLKKIIKTI